MFIYFQHTRTKSIITSLSDATNPQTVLNRLYSKIWPLINQSITLKKIFTKLIDIDLYKQTLSTLINNHQVYFIKDLCWDARRSAASCEGDVRRGNILAFQVSGNVRCRHGRPDNAAASISRWLRSHTSVFTCKSLTQSLLFLLSRNNRVAKFCFSEMMPIYTDDS